MSKNMNETLYETIIDLADRINAWRERMDTLAVPLGAESNHYPKHCWTGGPEEAAARAEWDAAACDARALYGEALSASRLIDPLVKEAERLRGRSRRLNDAAWSAFRRRQQTEGEA